MKRLNSKSVLRSVLRIMFLVAACLAADAMAFVTIMAERTPSVPAFRLALPGLVCHAIVTAATRGAHAGDLAGFVLAVLVNASLAAAPFFLLPGTLRRIKYA